MPEAVVLDAGEIWEDMNRNMLRKERVFRIFGNNKGLTCPFKGVVCQEGYCEPCQIYHDWQKLGEIIVICAWCNKVEDRKPNFGKPVVSHGIRPSCHQKFQERRK